MIASPALEAGRRDGDDTTRDRSVTRDDARPDAFAPHDAAPILEEAP